MIRRSFLALISSIFVPLPIQADPKRRGWEVRQKNTEHLRVLAYELNIGNGPLFLRLHRTMPLPSDTPEVVENIRRCPWQLSLIGRQSLHCSCFGDVDAPHDNPTVAMRRAEKVARKWGLIVDLEV